MKGKKINVNELLMSTKLNSDTDTHLNYSQY